MAVSVTMYGNETWVLASKNNLPHMKLNFRAVKN